MSIYFVFTTYVIFGLDQLRLRPALQYGKEIVRISAILVFALIYYKHITSYLRIYLKYILILIAIMINGLLIASYTAHTGRPDFYASENIPKLMILGIKYGLQYGIVFLSAAFIGHVRGIQKNIKHVQTYLQRMTYLVRGIIIASALWQGFKFLLPEWFILGGYGELQSFAAHKAPPLYYLTGVDGYPRLSGIFSGPNEYGFFLVLMFGIVYRSLAPMPIRKKRIRRVMYLGSVVLTFSRGALIGIGIQGIIYFYTRYRRLVIRSILAGCVGVLGLSISKPLSTDTHLQSKIRNAKLISDIPRGVGPGTSGPSIYYNGCNHIQKPNKDIDCYLPENYYMQMIIDRGVQGLLLWILRMRLLFKGVKIHQQNKETQLLRFLGISFIGLLAEGMFLHVFESSIVNYLFFIPLGIVYGYVVAQNKSTLSPQ